MSRKDVAWLYRELPGLVERGVLTPASADALRAHYGPIEPGDAGRRILQVVFAAFGALLVGGGLMLILAHNWDELSRVARAAVAFGVLGAAQALALYASIARRESTAWIEASGAALLAAVGTSLAVVAQTYHVPGDPGGLQRTWLWLVLAVPYLLASRAAAIGFWGLLVSYCMSGSWWWWHTGAPWDPWLLAALGVPFAVLLVRRQPTGWATALVVVAAAIGIYVVGLRLPPDLIARTAWAEWTLAAGAAAVALAAIGRRESAEAWRLALTGPAFAAMLVCGLVGSFDEYWRRSSDTEGWSTGGLLTLIAGVGLILVATWVSGGLARARAFDDALWSIGGAAGAAALGLASVGLDLPAAVLINLWLAAAGLASLERGVREGGLARANRGLLTLSALALARFFDVDVSFLWRGLGFVVIGAGFLGANLWLMRTRRREAVS